MKVAVLHGHIPEGASKDEQDVLVQVQAVSEALALLGYDPISVPFSLDVNAAVTVLRSLSPSFAFNLVESVEGRGRLIHLAPAILDFLQIPYTGSGMDAMFLTSNKLLAKKLLRSAGIPTPAWIALGEPGREKASLPDHEGGWSNAEGEKPADGRDAPGDEGAENVWIVKSVWEHASVGLDEDSVMAVRDHGTLYREMDRRRPGLGGECFAERFIDGREFNLSLLAGEQGPEVLPAAEIRFDAFPEEKLRMVGYRAKWEEDSFEYRHTPRCFDFGPEDASLLGRLMGLARECWSLFGLRGYARVDFRVDRRGNPWVLEVNANPCLSPDAGFAAAAERRGLSFTDAVERIVRDR